MIKFNDSPFFNRLTIRRKLSEFNLLTRLSGDSEFNFIPALKSQLEHNNTVPVMWPDRFVNEVYVEYLNSLKYLSIQGRSCGIRVTPETISVHVWGEFLFSASTDISKDEFFNMYIMDSMNNIKFENIQYVQKLYSTVKSMVNVNE